MSDGVKKEYVPFKYTCTVTYYLYGKQVGDTYFDLTC